MNTNESHPETQATTSKVNLPYPNDYSVPDCCVACGEPAQDKKRIAYGRQVDKKPVAVAEFSVCNACQQAEDFVDKKLQVWWFVGFILFCVVTGWTASGGVPALWAFAGGAIVCVVVVMLAKNFIVERMNEDQKKRVKLCDQSVGVEIFAGNSKNQESYAIFTFGRSEFAQAFAKLNEGVSNSRTGSLIAQPDVKEEAPNEDDLKTRRERVASGLCPKCGNTVSSTDQNCPSCKVNLTFAHEHLDQL